MALGFEVHGPTKIQVDMTGGTDNLVDLGYTDNNDLISFEMDYMTEPIMSSMMGNIPEQYVHLGTIGYLNMTLVKWDTATMDDLIFSVPGGTTEGAVGTVGGLRLGAEGTTDQTFATNFSVKLVCATSGDAYLFENCLIEGRGVKLLDFGNKAQRVGLSIVCLPYSDTDNVHHGDDNIYSVTRA